MITQDRAVTSARFDALGTYVYLSTRRPDELAAAREIAEQILSDVDLTCSRFRPDSDLSRVNERDGRWVEVDRLLACAVQAACNAAEQTAGLVNPLLGVALVRLGYDRDFGLIDVKDDSDLAPLAPSPNLEAWREIEVDLRGAIRIPANTALDLGATAKAWAADLIANACEEELDGDILVSLGGDIATSGQSEAEPWEIAITERPGGATDQLVTLTSGGLATSSTQVRHWRRNGVRRHHILDPRTGFPCPEVWRTVTATGASCLAANVAATASIVLGDNAPEWLRVTRG